MTTKMRRQTTYKLLTAALCSALLIAGCQKDDTKVSVPQPANGVLSFGISQDSGWSSPATKGETPAPVTKGESFRSEMLLMECDDPDSPLGDVYIYMVEEDIPEQQAAENLPATRAEEVPAEGNATVVDGAYGVFAYQGSGNVPETYTPGEGVVPFQDIQNLSLNSLGKYEGEDIYAPGAGFWLQFIAYAPYRQVAATEESTDNPALFANVGYPSIRYVATPELAKTTDLLFGGRRGTDGKLSPISGDLNTNDNGTPPVQLSLSHILSKIRIHTGTVAAGRITSISLKGIKNTGTYNLGNDGKWTLTDYSQDYTKTAAEGNVSFDDLYLMPQEFTDDAVLEIKVSVTAAGSETVRAITRDYTLTKKLKAFLAPWSPNKQYTYTISTPHEVEVEVLDDVTYEGEYPVKKDMVVKNTGLADAYVRVAINGAWVVNDGTEENPDILVVSAWEETDGEFTWPTAGKPTASSGTPNTATWRLGPDGYYYYMKPIAPGESTMMLFDKYTLKAPSPQSGAYLELTILAQGVFTNDIAFIFPEEIYKALKPQSNN